MLFAPLYLSNYCINGCTYCPYHAKNRTIPRRKLSQQEIEEEVRALIRIGHKRLAVEAGEDPRHNPLEYIIDSIKTIYSVREGGNSIRRVNVNIAATDVDSYRKLHEAGIGTYILFQETYNKENYQRLHPTGPKSNYEWHTEAMDRAQETAFHNEEKGHQDKQKVLAQDQEDMLFLRHVFSFSYNLQIYEIFPTFVFQIQF